jgi:hypothetical protein
MTTKIPTFKGGVVSASKAILETSVTNQLSCAEAEACAACCATTLTLKFRSTSIHALNVAANWE